MKILPSLAAADVACLADEIKKIEQTQASGIHFDAMDGHFVPLLTWGVPILQRVKDLTHLPLDVHIMVTNPDDVYKDYTKAGAHCLTFPLETARHAHRLCENIREHGVLAGVALNPSTHWQQVEFLLPFLDKVTIMMVNPGFSRQKPIPFMLHKLAQLSAHCQSRGFDIALQVDGGISLHNAWDAAQAGATELVAGGAIFNEKDYTVAISRLMASCHNPIA